MERQTEPPINPKTKTKTKTKKPKKKGKSEHYHGLYLHWNKRKSRKRKEKRTSRRKRWEMLLYDSPEKSHSQRKVWNGWRGSFSEEVKERYLRRVKKENEKWRSFKSKSPKELETGGKPNSPTSENINSINRNMPHGHSPRSVATTHLIRHLIPRVTKKKKKLFIFYGRHGVPWWPKNRGATDGSDEIN